MSEAPQMVELDGQEATEAYSSRVQHLLSSNEAPLSQERRDLRLALSADSAELDRMEARIAALCSELSQLLKEQQRKKRKLEDYKAILHPIRSMPDGILHEIFAISAALPFHQIHHPTKGSLDQRAMPWVISGVCAKWRTVALSQQSLWSTIIITGADLRLSVVQPPTRSLLLGMQLSRSGSSPLTVSIHSEQEISSSHPLMLVLTPSCNRWKVLGFSAPLESTSILAPLAGFPIPLEDLSFFPTGTSPRQLNLTPRQHIQASPLAQIQLFLPRLKKLCTFTSYAPHIPVPRHQIEELEGVGSDDLPQALAALPNLRRCDLKLDSNNAENEIEILPRPVVSQHLRSLILRSERETSSAPVWFSQIHLPSLHSLKLKNVKDQHAIHELLQQSPLLRKMGIWSSSITDRECISFLADRVGLKALKLHCPAALTSRLLESFINHDPVLVPSLRSLTFLGLPYTDEEVSRLKAERPALVIYSQ